MADPTPTQWITPTTTITLSLASTVVFLTTNTIRHVFHLRYDSPRWIGFIASLLISTTVYFKNSWESPSNLIAVVIVLVNTILIYATAVGFAEISTKNKNSSKKRGSVYKGADGDSPKKESFFIRWW